MQIVTGAQIWTAVGEVILSYQNAFLGNAISVRLAVNARPVHVIGSQGDNGLPQKSKREEQTQTRNSSYDAMRNQRMAELMAEYRPCII